MSRNGSGVYSLPAGNPVVTLTQISSTWANTTLTDIATELTNSIDKGGRTAPTANLPMAGYKHTGAAVASAAGQYVTYNQAGVRFPALGIGTASAAWGSSFSSIDFDTRGGIGSSAAAGLYITQNSYIDNSGDPIAKETAAAMRMEFMTASAKVQSAPSVSAGAVQTFSTVVEITSTGAAVTGALTGTSIALATPIRFRALSTATRSSGTGEMATYGSEVYDVGTAFNPTTGRFTAPATGLYYFSFVATSNSSAGSIITAFLRVNGGATNYFGVNASTSAAGDGGSSGSGGFLYLTAADYVSVFATVAGGAACLISEFNGVRLG